MNHPVYSNARCIRKGVASSLYAVYIRRWKLHRGVRHHLALHSLERGNKSRRSRSTGVLATDPDCTVMSDRVVAKRLLTLKGIFLNVQRYFILIYFSGRGMNVLLERKFDIIGGGMNEDDFTRGYCFIKV